mgnify:FL=1
MPKKSMFPGKTRLAAKIIKMLSLIWIIPCVIIAALWIKGRIEFVYDSFEKDSAAALQNLRIETASNAARIDTSASSALSQREFVRFCTSDMDADGLQLVKFSQNELKTIRSIFQSNDIIEEASLFFDNPQIYEIWPTIYGLDRLKNTPFEEIVPSGQSAVYAVEDGEVYGCYRIYLDITPVGLLRLRLDSDKFFSGFSNANAASCLLAANGELFSNEENLFSAEELQAVLTDSPDMPSRSTYQAVLEKDGRSYLVRYSWLELLNAWAVVYEDQADLLQPVYQMGASVLAVMLLGMCVIWVLVQYVCQSMLKRLALLEKKMLAVQSGNLDIRIPERENGGDELDTLSKSFNGMLDRMQQLVDENIQRGLAVKQAELDALQSQINSHFLYNALESIRMLSEVHGDTEVAETVFSLGSLMRYHMKWKTKTVTLSEELDCIDRYIFFMSASNGTEIRLESTLPREVLNAEIPKLSIQPLVENAIVHGMPADSRRIVITLKCRQEDGLLILSVTDNGIGIAPERLHEIQCALNGSGTGNIRSGKNGIGVVNVHQRIQLMYGEACGLRFISCEGLGTSVEVRIPARQDALGGW